MNRLFQYIILHHIVVSTFSAYNRPQVSTFTQIIMESLKGIGKSIVSWFSTPFLHQNWSKRMYNPVPGASDTSEIASEISGGEKHPSGRWRIERKEKLTSNKFVLLGLLLGNLLLLFLNRCASHTLAWHQKPIAGSDLYGWVPEEVNVKEDIYWWKTQWDLGALSLDEDIVQDDAKFAKTAKAWVDVWNGTHILQLLNEVTSLIYLQARTSWRQVPSFLPLATKEPWEKACSIQSVLFINCTVWYVVISSPSIIK